MCPFLLLSVIISMSLSQTVLPAEKIKKKENLSFLPFIENTLSLPYGNIATKELTQRQDIIDNGHQKTNLTSEKIQQNPEKINPGSKLHHYVKDESTTGVKTNASKVHEDKTEILEEKLKKQNDTSSLLLAIMILHGHVNDSLLENEDQSRNETSEGIKSTRKVEIEKNIVGTQKSPPKSVLQRANYRSYILLLDGNCLQIHDRMNTFVKYLKATLASKFDGDFNDIYVPSVICDKIFVVNVTFDTNKYPSGYSVLKKLARENSTLLEISGNIFYLENVLIASPHKHKLKDFLRKNEEVRLVTFISLSCICAFVLFSVVLLIFMRYYRCRRERESAKEDGKKNENSVNIYTPHFTQCIKSSATSSTISDDGSCDMVRIPECGQEPFKISGNRVPSFCKTSSQLKLIQELQEDDNDTEEDLYLYDPN